MNIGEILIAVLMAVAGGAAGAAVINGINERWKFKAGRKAAKEDREEEKADKTAELTKTIAGLQEDIKRLRSSDAAQSEALKQILLDRRLPTPRGTERADSARQGTLSRAGIHRQGRNFLRRQTPLSRHARLLPQGTRRERRCRHHR